MTKNFMAVTVIAMMFAGTIGCIGETDDDCADVSNPVCVVGESYCVDQQFANYCSDIDSDWGVADCSYVCRDSGGGCCTALMDGSGQSGCLCCNECTARGIPCI